MVGYLTQELVEIGVDKVPASPRLEPDLALVDHHDVSPRMFGQKGCRIDHQGRSEDEQEITSGDHGRSAFEVMDGLSEKDDIRFDDASANTARNIVFSHHFLQ